MFGLFNLRQQSEKSVPQYDSIGDGFGHLVVDFAPKFGWIASNILLESLIFLFFEVERFMNN